MKSPIKLSLIAACDKKMGIGKNGTLPWKLKNEMAYFNKMTLNVATGYQQNAVIMGRKTWESIPKKFKPLSGRLNIVLSNSMNEKPEGALLFKSLNEAVTTLKNEQNIDKVWIIGGYNVYKEAMLHPLCDKVYLTDVEGDFECDTFFPTIPDSFVMLEDHGEEKHLVPLEKQTEGDISYYFRIYEKKHS